ncbi:MAG: cytochrome C [Rhodocyclaceae bacterium]|nr:cytochrome C [Rhodocyclaceae bacterium]
MHKQAIVLSGLAALGLSTLSLPADAGTPSDPLVERGRYIARVAGCNDCHTPGYMQSGGQVPESRWLTGDSLGWQGPWGTTYAINLRRYMATLSEDQWLERARHLNARPPMPWFALRDMADDDLRAIYRLVRALGPLGEPAPAFVPPGGATTGPVVSFPMPPG